MTKSPLPHWSTVASRHVFRDRWISVRADDCVTDTGVAIAPFYVLEYPDWVQIVALDAQDNLVLARQYRHGLGRVSLELPAGTMDPEDPDPVATAARELLEETGYGGAARMRLVGTLSPNPANHANRAYVVLAEGVAPLRPPAADATEVIAVELMPCREALRRVVDGSIVHAIHIASLILGLQAAGKIDLA